MFHKHLAPAEPHGPVTESFDPSCPIVEREFRMFGTQTLVNLAPPRWLLGS